MLRAKSSPTNNYKKPIRSRHKKMVGALAFTTAFFTFQHAYAVNRTWDAEAGNSDWFNAVNWSSNLQPVAVDNALITINTPVVLSTASTQITQLRIYQALGSTETVTINNGAVLQTEGTYVGLSPSTTGTLLVTGENSRLNATTLLRVANNTDSVGILNILAGGSVFANDARFASSANSNATILVSGENSTLNTTSTFLPQQQAQPH